jgi:hypothetical protein
VEVTTSPLTETQNPKLAIRETQSKKRMRSFTIQFNEEKLGNYLPNSTDVINDRRFATDCYSIYQYFYGTNAHLG